MKILKATSTLDGLLPPLDWTTDASEAEILLVGGKAVDLPLYPKLRGIFKCGVGTDNLPFDEAAARGIEIRLPSDATRGVLLTETADFACHLILRCLYSDIGDWDTWTKAQRPALSGRRLLVIGAGRIGGMVAAKMRAFLAVDTYDAATDPPDRLEPLMRAADAVSLHIPLLPETRGFLDAEKLAWLRDGASVINTARGPVIDEDALHAELAAGRLRAAIDVWWQEPYTGKLLDLPDDGRLIRSPHVASTCRDWLENCAEDFLAMVEELTQRR